MEHVDASVWAGRGLRPSRLVPPTTRPELLERPRVRASFDALVDRPVWLVMGPAGSGKTTAVAQFLATGPAFAWLTLDATLDDPARLVGHLMGALTRAGLVPEPETWPHPEACFDPWAWITEHVIVPLAGEGPPVTLVLDDVHALRDREGILAFIVAERPPRLRLVLVSEWAPGLPLARLEADGVLGRLDARELWFQPAEAEVVLERWWGDSLSTEQRGELLRCSEGWPAALRLLIPQAPSGDAGASTRRAVDFLVEEIVERLTDERLGFMLEIAVVDPVTPSLAEALTKRPDAPSMLWTLVDAGLVSPLGEEAGVRVQPLLREALLRRLERDAERQAMLHGRAARHLARQGQLHDAIEHARHCGEATLLLELAETHGLTLLRARRMQTLSTLLAALEPTQRRSRAMVSVLEAWTSLGDSTSAARRAVGQAREALDTASLGRWPRPVLEASLRALEAFISLREGTPPKGLDALYSDPTLPPGLMVAVALAVGLAAERDGRASDAENSFERGSAMALAASPPLPSGLVCLAHRIRVLRTQSRAADAVALAERGEGLAVEHGWSRWPASAEVTLERSILDLSEGRLDAAERRARAALVVLRRGDDAASVSRGLLGLAMIRRARGDHVGAADAEAESEALARGAGIPALVEALTEHRRRRSSAEEHEPRIEPAAPSREKVLSERELEVLSLVALGLSNRIVAQRLFISPVTVKTHVHHILAKLGARNRTEAVHQARRRGLLD